MTAHPTRILTEGEAQLLAVAKLAPENAARSAAIDAISQNGFPTRRIEAFHYTDLRALMSGEFKCAERPDDMAASEAGKAFPRLAQGAAVLHFRDGHFFDMGEVMPKDVIVADGEIAIPKSVEPANSVELINTALNQSVKSLKVAKGAHVKQVIGLAATPCSFDGTIGAHRVSIDVGANAKCELIERSVGPDNERYGVSSVVDLNIAQGADVTYVLSMEDGDIATRLGRLTVTLQADSKLNLFILNIGGELVRQEIVFDILGENVDLNIAGVNLIGGKAHMDITSQINHAAPNTNSTELMRNVSTERGRGVFQGQIKVAQPAQLTDAQMACNTLLLSDDCDFSAKPELEIFADDVQCAHGATVTDLEESYLFYLMARGIPEVRARRMLIKAFVAEAFEELADETLEQALEDRMDVWLDKHV